MPHLDARACGGNLAALAMALGWRQGSEAGTHSWWRRNGPSIVLTCVSGRWAAWWHCCACPPPLALPGTICAAWMWHCMQGGAGLERRAQPLSGQPRSRVAQPWERTNPQLLRCLSGLCTGSRCRRESVSRRHPPSVASECCRALPVRWDVDCTGVRLLHPAPMPALCLGSGQGSCTRLTSAAQPGGIPCGKNSWGQRGDQWRSLLQCQHMPGVLWHHMLGCDAGTAQATSLGQLSAAHRGQSPCSCCVSDSNTQAAPRAEAPSSRELCPKSIR